MDNVKEYLSFHWLNTDSVAENVNRANNCICLKILEDRREENPNEYNILLIYKNEHRSLYECWQFPAVGQRGLALQLHIDVPMHLLFLEVTKSIVIHIMDWTTAQGQNAALMTFSSGVLQSVANLGMNWCVALELTGPSFGGWVSENFLALARLSRWFFPMLEGLKLTHHLKNRTAHTPHGTSMN